MMGDTAVDGSSQSTSSQSKRRKMDKKKTIINDPIWGPIELDPLCMKIINTQQFQRLRHIKQLGGCSFVYPGACHSRFEHSIGTAHLARMMGEELQKKHTNETITNQEIICLEVAGLCHDLGHGPFSHLFDQQFQNKCKDKKWTHEDLSIKILDTVFETLERSVDLKALIGNKGKELIKALIEPSREMRKEKPFLYEIISNEENKIDVDKWDYFSRDCHMLGLHHNFQCQRSIKLARIVDNHISFPKSEYFNLFDMFYTRFTLHRKAYQHPVVKAVEMMIADAFLKADSFLAFPPMRKPGQEAGRKRLSESMECMNAYQWVTDDVLQQISRLEHDPNDKTDRRSDAQDIIDRIYCRDLYKLIGEKRVKWEKESIKNAAEKLKTVLDFLKQSTMEIDILKDHIAEILKTNLPETKSVKQKIDEKLTTLVSSLNQSSNEIASLGLPEDKAEILETYPFPDIKSVIEDIGDQLENKVKIFIQEKIKAGIVQGNIAEELTTDQVPKKLYEIEAAVFSYGRGQKNPMEKVKFHQIKAQRNPNDNTTDQYESVNSEVMDEKKSDMLPTSFEEIYIRLYWKGVGKDEKEIDKKRKDILEEAFLDINRTFKGELVNI